MLLSARGLTNRAGSSQRKARLAELKELYSEGLISLEDLQARIGEIISEI